MQSEFARAMGTARAAVVAIFVLAGLSFSAWAVRIPDVKRALQLDEATLGLVLLGTAAGSVVAMSASGWTIARFGSRRVTTVAGMLVCATLPLPPLAPTVPFFGMAGMMSKSDMTCLSRPVSGLSSCARGSPATSILRDQRGTIHNA